MTPLLTAEEFAEAEVRVIPLGLELGGGFKAWAHECWTYATGLTEADAAERLRARLVEGQAPGDPIPLKTNPKPPEGNQHEE